MTGHRNHFAVVQAPVQLRDQIITIAWLGQPERGIAVLAVAAAAQCALWRNPKPHIERMGGGVTGPH